MYKSLAKTLFVGKKVVFLTTCHSTNETASDKIRKDNLPDGTLVITDQQTAGRGQRGNRWEAEPGKNLTFSLVFYPRFLPASHQFLLTCAVSLGITEALDRMLPEVEVKWPNDIYSRGKKLGGILIQNSIRNNHLESSVVGVGLNVNQVEFNYPNAVSIAALTNRESVLSEVLEEICYGIEARYLQLRESNRTALVPDYLKRLYRFGEDHLYKTDQVFSGRIVNVLSTGELVMDTDSGERIFRNKEVEFV